MKKEIKRISLILLLATAVSLIGYPNPASAATFNVKVGVAVPGSKYNFRFSPSSVTIHPGDQVKWTWASGGHSTTSVDGLWDSGVRNQGATFTRTFNREGTFGYVCANHALLEHGIVVVTSATPTPTPTPTPIPPPSRATVADFNGDGHLDAVVQNAITHQTVVGYLNNAVFIGAAFGPTLPTGWRLAGAADFDGDGHIDYVLFNPATGETVIEYLSDLTVIGTAVGGLVPVGWELVRAADFNGDAHPDYLLFNASTGETMIDYLNNTVSMGEVHGPTLSAGWNLIDVADFNGDGHPDYSVFNSGTGQTAIAYLSGSTLFGPTTVIGSALGPTLPLGWSLVATADFDGDGHPDYLLYNAATGQTSIDYLSNNVLVNAVLGPILPGGWSLLGQ